MIPSQAEIEEILRAKAVARVPRLTKALEKLERFLERKAVYVKNAKLRAERKVANAEELVASYKKDLATIEAGSYPGYNGQPFGAAPTITKGIIG